MAPDAEQQHAMQTDSGNKTISLIAEFDVVLGRASGTQGHQGNFRYRSICQKAATWYHAARGNSNLKRAIVYKVINDVSPGRFLKRLPDESFITVEGKERFIKVQTDLRTGRIGRMMNKSMEVPKEQLDAAVAALESQVHHENRDEIVVPAIPPPRPNHGTSVMRTVSASEEFNHDVCVPDNHQAIAAAKTELEAEYLELAKEKEVLVMRNKILELKEDLKNLREYNRQLESGHSVPD